MGAIVWLASYPRSGNTWMRAFLHNLLAASRGEAASADINRMGKLTTWDIAPKWYQPHLRMPLAQASPADIAEARPKVHHAIAAASDGLVFVKTHSALSNSHGTPTITRAVTAGAIHIVRNPLDVCVSLAQHLGIDTDQAIALMARKGHYSPVHRGGACECYGSWSEHTRSWSDSQHRSLLHLRYEDLLDQPEASFGRVARHLRIRVSDAALAEAIERSGFRRLRAQEDQAGFRERPRASRQFFRSGQRDAWRTALSTAQAQRLRRNHAEQMLRWGY